MTPRSAYSLIRRLTDLGILVEAAGFTAPRVYVADAIIRATMPEEAGPPP